jgi:adenylosuccinate lyase
MPMKLNPIQAEVITKNLHQAHSLIELIQSASIDSTHPNETLSHWQSELELLFILLDDMKGCINGNWHNIA